MFFAFRSVFSSCKYNYSSIHLIYLFLHIEFQPCHVLLCYMYPSSHGCCGVPPVFPLSHECHGEKFRYTLNNPVMLRMGTWVVHHQQKESGFLITGKPPFYPLVSTCGCKPSVLVFAICGSSNLNWQTNDKWRNWRWI